MIPTSPASLDSVPPQFLSELEDLAHRAEVPSFTATPDAAAPPPDVWESARSEATVFETTLQTTKEKALDYFDVDAEARPKGGMDWQGMRDHLLEEAGDAAAAQVAAVVKRHVAPPPLPKKSLLWHYALDDESHGPVSEEELLNLLTEGEVKLSTLVWNKTMSEWIRLADTPLSENAAPAPPPLPPTKKSSKTKSKGKAASTTCPSCGRVTSPEDSFCPDCGTPLKT
ncbi:GYF domain-containing protein [Prosthecobacter sp.]|uniref:GYF domain-containing protein n=1 Tax=Prosthecobacter sp. TaxID=1965333 RepID=UPI002AB92B37|nr:GYF domain-containing protein [Prosthecobacter sp.]MDZ4403185.1 GYF domain-containing protein [Prosthecobacter sp.]